ncbi:MAG: UDP-4-amino-4,6-dideoxy-N-acetyl-beta-L-altrosamine transaminase [Alphaproteobacteria bacterium]|nr:UDP-4-amino-4,6-dideoxy-N-acetyl-beta-L-altrosamine transaminase [Alphaproteobacteria bacterium]
MIPYGRQDIQESDIAAVLEVLRSDFLTQGPAVPHFEQIVATHCKVGYAVAVNSATSALHVALMALDVGVGDIVWTSPNTFVASANAALYCGAKVDFVDIDPDTYNMSISALRAKLENAEELGELPKVVIPVHLAGQSCDMRAIHELAQRYSFKLVEDASHAIGGRYRDEPVGNCAYSDITVFSFHPVKIVTSAEGGIAVTNQAELAQKMGLYRSHGITRDPALMTNAVDAAWYYQQIALGYNYRMTDLQAALGASQMTRLYDYVKHRHVIANRYALELAHLPLNLPKQAEYAYSAYHLYVIRLDLASIAPLKHTQVFQSLRDRNILVNLHYIPVHTQPYYQNMGFSWGDFPHAENYYRSAISIPIFPTLTDVEQTQIIKALHEILTK